MEKVTTSVFLCTGKLLSLQLPTPSCSDTSSLWGNPTHLQYVASALRACYDQSILQILIVKRNSGTFTYDGIETGGERVTREIEDAIEEYARNGVEIRKISIVGYSLGGLGRDLARDKLIAL